jgi:hypothetical protein
MRRENAVRVIAAGAYNHPTESPPTPPAAPTLSLPRSDP